MGLPDFLIIGAQKSGTSWLGDVIRRHPEAHVPIEEIHFFNKRRHYEKGLAWYESLFDGGGHARAVGEVTPNYFLTYPQRRDAPLSWRMFDIPRLVSERLPRAKLVLLLRDPVERAVAAYYHYIRGGFISPQQRLRDVWDQYGMRAFGYYDEHLIRWRKHFPQNQLQVHIFEEAVRQNRAATARRTYQFLGLDPDFRPGDLHEKKNPRSSHAYMRLKNFSSRLAHYLPRELYKWPLVESLAHIPVRQEERRALRREYAPHIARLEDLLDRSLPWN